MAKRKKRPQAKAKRIPPMQKMQVNKMLQQSERDMKRNQRMIFKAGPRGG